MTRGTTPTHSTKLPVEAESLTQLNIAYEQNGDIVVEKGLSDVTKDGFYISWDLSEAETLKFVGGDNREVNVQIRCGVGDKRFASKIKTLTVDRIIKDGALT